MAVLASVLLALIVLLPCSIASAGDLFTGVRLDNDEEYFAYLGLKEELPWKPLDLGTYVQLFASGQTYTYEAGSLDIDARVQTLTPSLGVNRLMGGGPWKVSALAGLEMKWTKEDGAPVDRGRHFNTGVFVQTEAMYWQEPHSLHAMVSYASLDSFFFGRIRGKLRTHSPETGCCSVSIGLDLVGMGNNDFEAVQVGPLVEVPVGRFWLLARAGFQQGSSNGSGGYGGLEIYTQF